jgi:hypothetical protein
VRESIPGRGKMFFLLHIVQTACGAHPASYPIGTVGSFLKVKRQEREADHSPYLVPRSRIVELLLHSPIRTHGIVLNESSIRTILHFYF